MTDDEIIARWIVMQQGYQLQREPDLTVDQLLARWTPAYAASLARQRGDEA